MVFFIFINVPTAVCCTLLIRTKDWRIATFLLISRLDCFNFSANLLIMRTKRKGMKEKKTEEYDT
jgi:hypothetical protein